MAIVDHAEATELYSPYWDEELPEDTKRALEEHMGSCLVCRREYAAFERAVSALAAGTREVAPPDFVAGVVKRVHKRSRGRFFDPSGVLRRTDRLPYELFSLLMLALLLGIYVILHASQPGHLNLP